MSKPLNNTLPTELLIIVFQNLNATHLRGKKDLSTCLSVCKSWKVAAQLLFGELSIKFDEGSMEKLSKYLVFLEEKVKKIKLTRSHGIRMNNRIDDSLVWFDKVISFLH